MPLSFFKNKHSIDFKEKILQYKGIPMMGTLEIKDQEYLAVCVNMSEEVIEYDMVSVTDDDKLTLLQQKKTVYDLFADKTIYSVTYYKVNEEISIKELNWN